MAPLLLICKLLIDVCLMPLKKSGRARADTVGIVRLDAIGDFVVWLPAAQALIAELRTQGKREITLIANALWAEWAQRLLDVDHVIAVNTNRFSAKLSYRADQLKNVRDLKLATVIIPTYSRIPGDGNDAFAFASGAPERIANKGYRSRHRLAGWLRQFLNLGYSRVVETDAREPGHPARVICESEINANFNKALGITQDALIGTLEAGELALEPPLPPPGTFVQFIPGGSWSGKAWPVKRFAEIARRLRAEGFEIIVTGSASERALCEELAQACRGRNLAGETTLQELAEITRTARLVIGNDSAGMHIAVAARTDSICVMWGGSFGRFIPYPAEIVPLGVQARAVFHKLDCFGCTGACPYPMVDDKVKCVDAVPVSHVWAAVQEVLRLDRSTAAVVLQRAN